MMKIIFTIVMSALKAIASLTHTTYNEVNIIVYYLIIPLSWAIMIDIIIKSCITSLLFIVVWMYIILRTHSYFKRWCDKGFKKSVDFLLWFKRVGWNYTVSSVILCVIVPIIIYGLLIYML